MAVKPSTRAGLGIVTKNREFWIHEVFETADDAQDRFREQFHGDPFAPDWSEFDLVPARLTIEEVVDD